jgi:hypothetical protein
MASGRDDKNMLHCKLSTKEISVYEQIFIVKLFLFLEPSRLFSVIISMHLQDNAFVLHRKYGNYVEFFEKFFITSASMKSEKQRISSAS